MFLFGQSLGSNSILLVIKDLDSVNLEVLSYNAADSVDRLQLAFCCVSFWELEFEKLRQMRLWPWL